MAGKKGKAQANEKRAEETIGQLPSYPYGAKSPKTPDSQAIPPTDPPTEREKSSEADGTEGLSVVSYADHKEDVDSTKPDATDNNTKTPEPCQGDTLPASVADVTADAEPTPREGMAAAERRWRREGRSYEVAAFRDVARAEYTKAHPGCRKRDAHDWAWEAAIKSFPPGEVLPMPPPPEPVISPEITTSAPPADDLPGLYSIPPDWPPLPDNAALQVELGWVQSQRLAVVEERGNSTVVRLERASSPAPSKAALGWLETSIRSYAKYIEVTAKILAGAADEAEATRRERMRLDDIRALLDEMHRDQV